MIDLISTDKMIIKNLLILILLIASSCFNFKQNDSCKEITSRAKKSISEYYKTSDSTLLSDTLKELDSCTENSEISYLKVQIYSLLGDCESGLEYAQSITVKDVDYPYKKVLFENVFNACLTPEKKLVWLEKTLESILAHLALNPKNVDAWYDLINTKSQMISKKQLISEMRIATDSLTNSELKSLILAHPELN